LLVGDSMRIGQILTNYMSNALKFTERGYITLKMTSTKVDSQHLHLRYEVADTGCGIAEDKIPLLFEKFSEIDIGASRQHNGAGLGLAICREIAGLMGGRVGVDSVQGIGSVFWLEVALPVDQSASIPLSVAEAETEMDRPGEIAQLKILIAEDHPVNQKLFQALIAHMNHALTIVGNGAEAVAALKREDFDLVLMDANMPVMDGAEATRHIRALEGVMARVPIIAVTAEAMVGDRERFLGLGMDDYIAKPIDARELAAIITRYGGKAEKIGPDSGRETGRPAGGQPQRSAG